LKRLLCDADNRLGAGGIHEIKQHPFFKGLDWDKIRGMKASFQPDVKDDEDCSRFDKFDEEAPFYPPEDSGQSSQSASASKKNKKRKDINFPGYTYKKEVEDQKSKLVQALKGLLNHDADGAGAGDGEDDGYQSPPEQEQKIPK
jgi:hypothetical protein